MSGTFKPRMGILPASQQRIWPELGAAVELGFVLYVGTAIALRLGHRPSVDFDFFSDRPLDRDAIQAAFPFMTHATVLQDERNALSVLVPYGDSDHTHVKVSFFGTIGYGRVGDPDVTDDRVVQVASLAARELFGSAFQPSESLKAMVFFDDGDLRTLTNEDKNTLVGAVCAVRDLPVVAVLSNQLSAGEAGTRIQ